jgi:multidrug efflux pump subunit AcrA (membrane-fusion protein)
VRRTRRAAVYVNGQRIEASRLTVFPQASPTSGTFRARLDLPENATDLYPGMTVKAGFVVGETRRLLVPRGAMVERGEVTALYVLDDAGRAVLRQVRPGREFEGRVEILAGLSAGERVALDPFAAANRLAARAGAQSDE